jgi:superfamily I DNA and/or RNA helicase
MSEQFGDELRAASMLQEQMNSYHKRFKELEFVDDDTVRKNLLHADRSFYSWMSYTSIQYYQMLLDDGYKDLYEILHLERKEDLLKQFNQFISNGANLRRLLRVFPIILTTNQSAYRLGEPDRYFDLVVMDEAGQCSIGYALIPILRGERLILVGDEKQLRPVLSLSKEANKIFMRQYRVPSIYNYSQSSILMLMKEVDQFSKKILLREHYRCKKQIIDFCNQKYYGNNLIIHDQS